MPIHFVSLGSRHLRSPWFSDEIGSWWGEADTGILARMLQYTAGYYWIHVMTPSVADDPKRYNEEDGVGMR